MPAVCTWPTPSKMHLNGSDKPWPESLWSKNNERLQQSEKPLTETRNELILEPKLRPIVLTTACGVDCGWNMTAATWQTNDGRQQGDQMERKPKRHLWCLLGHRYVLFCFLFTFIYEKTLFDTYILMMMGQQWANKRESWQLEPTPIFQPLMVCYSTTPTWHKK